MRFVITAIAFVYLSTLGLAVSQQEKPASITPPSDRFDFEVRADFFAGFSGDVKRFAKAMARCEEVLAAYPNHAEALVWHGSGLVTQAGQLLGKGDTAKGMELWGRGLGEMNRAVTLEPDNAGVRIPRGATLFEASRHVPDPQLAMGLVKVALSDYEHTLLLQKTTFSRLSDHAKGELLFGLAEGWARAGDKEKARDYFTRLIKDAATSGRVSYANAWLDGKPPATVGACVGCH
jgi:hypothetical protein